MCSHAERHAAGQKPILGRHLRNAHIHELRQNWQKSKLSREHQQTHIQHGFGTKSEDVKIRVDLLVVSCVENTSEYIGNHGSGEQDEDNWIRVHLHVVWCVENTSWRESFPVDRVRRLGYPRPPVFDGAGVPWVLTGTDQRDAPSRQDDGVIRAPTLCAWCCHGREWVVTRATFQLTLSAVTACRVARSTREAAALVYPSSSSRPSLQLLWQILIVLSTCSSTAFDSSATVCTSSCESLRCLISCSPFCHLRPTSLGNLFESPETCIGCSSSHAASSLASVELVHHSSGCSPFVAFSVSRVFPATHLAAVVHLMHAPILRFFCCLLNNLLFLERLNLDEICVPLQVFFSTQFTSLHFFVMSCNITFLVHQRCSLHLCLGTFCLTCFAFDSPLRALHCARHQSHRAPDGIHSNSFLCEVGCDTRHRLDSLVCTLPVLVHCRLHTCFFSDTSFVIAVSRCAACFLDAASSFARFSSISCWECYLCPLLDVCKIDTFKLDDFWLPSVALSWTLWAPSKTSGLSDGRYVASRHSCRACHSTKTLNLLYHWELQSSGTTEPLALPHNTGQQRYCRYAGSGWTRHCARLSGLAGLHDLLSHIASHEKVQLGILINVDHPVLHKSNICPSNLSHADDPRPLMMVEGVCGEVEDVVGALTPVGSGVAQVLHDLLVELRLLLVAEVEEGEEEDRQEEGEEVKGGSQVEETTTTWMAMMMVVSGVRTRLELEPWCECGWSVRDKWDTTCIQWNCLWRRHTIVDVLCRPVVNVDIKTLKDETANDKIMIGRKIQSVAAHCLRRSHLRTSKITNDKIENGDLAVFCAIVSRGDISKCRARDGEWRQNILSHAHFSQSCCVWHAHAWALFNHACMRDSSLHKSLCTCDVWSGLRHYAWKTPLHPLCLIPTFSVAVLSRSPRFSLYRHSHLRQHALRNQRGHRWWKSDTAQAQLRQGDSLTDRLRPSHRWRTKRRCRNSSTIDP